MNKTQIVENRIRKLEEAIEKIEIKLENQDEMQYWETRRLKEKKSWLEGNLRINFKMYCDLTGVKLWVT